MTREFYDSSLFIYKISESIFSRVVFIPVGTFFSSAIFECISYSNVIEEINLFPLLFSLTSPFPIYILFTHYS